MYARKFKAGLRPTWAMLDSYKWRQRLKSNGYRYGARVRENFFALFLCSQGMLRGLPDH